MNYVFIDESGELAKQTKYFVFGAVLVDNPKTLDNVINKARRKYKKQLSNYPEIKGHKTDKYIIKKILSKLNNTKYKAVVIYIDKRNLYKIHNSYDYNIFYDALATKLAEELPINTSTSIIVDKNRKKSTLMDNFSNLFNSHLNNPKNFPIHIHHADSVNYKGLQIADLISWSVFQSLEHNNTEFVDLIENKTIKEVFKE